MGLGMLVLIAGAAAAGYYGVRRLKDIEREIRDESRPSPQSSPAVAVKVTEVKPVVPKSAPPKAAARPKPAPAGPEKSLEEKLLQKVNQNSGLLQTDLYDLFPDQDRKAMQALLLKMTKEGAISREKEKSTFRVFPGSQKEG